MERRPLPALSRPLPGLVSLLLIVAAVRGLPAYVDSNGLDRDGGADNNGGAGPHPDIAAKRYCDGPCPSECGELLDPSRQCYTCRCLPELQFGDVVVPAEQHCPTGLPHGPTLLAAKICRGQGCRPGSQWKIHHDGCSRCVCTREGDPACTPCQRSPNESTATCEDGAKECPQDCGMVYNPGRDCYDCPCGVGEPGDIHVDFEETCPPGTDFREAGAFFIACGPVDTLPKGDTRVCDTLECPADCGTVRVSRKEGCVYCQCGPELAPGDEVVPIEQQCPPASLPGPTQLATRVCRAPTRQECKPGSEYNLRCDICFCQENGIPACTVRNCSLPEYGDLPDCPGGYMHCRPVSCDSAEADSRCRRCQCATDHQSGGGVTPPVGAYLPPAPSPGEDDGSGPVKPRRRPGSEESSSEEDSSEEDSATPPRGNHRHPASSSEDDSNQGKPHRRHGREESSSEEDSSEERY